ncbi:MAG: hypothetical protein HKN12_07935, partial [Gemmatimonadetes bacterium]|nr:hypothetical protein [Gemmatimonadota bacterium]
HYVTGLMIRDYVAGLAPGSPMTYAEDYYLHYPKVAFGHWPPVFYLLQAGWTIPFGASRTSLMLLMAAVSAVIAVSLHRSVSRHYGMMAGVGAGILLLTVPLAQEFGRVVMADLPQALWSFLAVLCLAAYFERPRWWMSALFGLFAAAAILNKGTGVGLALVPIVMLLLTFRFKLMLKPSFWLSAVVVVGLAAPWYLLAPSAMHQSAVPLDFVVGGNEWRPRIRMDWIPEVGWWLIPLALLGVVRQVVQPLIHGRDAVGRDGETTRTRSVAPLWAAAAALIVSTLGFRAMTPITVDTRHVLPAVPALLMFAVAGGAWLLAVLRGPVARWRVAAAAVVIGFFVIGNVRALPQKQAYGFSGIAADLVADDSLDSSVFLVSADALGEGMFIAEVAMREDRPGHIVLRSSKVLSDSGWMGEGYSSRFDTAEQLMNYLDEIPVGILVLDDSQPRPQAHHRLLREVVTNYADRWEEAARYPAENRDGEMVVYRLEGHEGREVGPISLDFGPPRKRPAP